MMKHLIYLVTLLIIYDRKWAPPEFQKGAQFFCLLGDPSSQFFPWKYGHLHP